VDPLAVVHVVQEPAQLAVCVGEVAILGEVDLLLPDGRIRRSENPFSSDLPTAAMLIATPRPASGSIYAVAA
jgi:hypothetical protein